MKKLIMILLLSAGVGNAMATGDGATAPTPTEEECFSCLRENELLNWPSGMTRTKYLFQALEACPRCGVDLIQQNFNN